MSFEPTWGAMLTVLSFGGGQDSTAILYKIIHDPKFRDRYVRGELIVIMSDTGDEHKETYEHVNYMMFVAAAHGIPFYFVRPSDGFHPKNWQSLRQNMEQYDALMTKTFPKSCTDNLKIKPFYGFLNKYVGDKLGMTDEQIVRKAGLKAWLKQHGTIRVILGIADGEQRRISTEGPHKWMNDCIEKIYPLVDEGMDRYACQVYIESLGEKVPLPSNCILCPFMNDIELLWLYRFQPKDYYYWVEREKAKVRKMAARGLELLKNHGVNGVKMLEQKLQEVISKHGHMTDDELQEYKMSHGHCVMSKY